MANANWLVRVVSINEERNAEELRYIELCKQRLPNVPGSWELLTANSCTQSFCDGHGHVKYFDVRTGQELRPPDGY